MRKARLIIRREYRPDIERQIAALERVLSDDLVRASASAEPLPEALQARKSVV